MPPKRNVRYLWHIIRWARQKKVPFEIRSVLKCQCAATAELLRRKYGLTPSEGLSAWADGEWQVWLSVIGKAPAGLKDSFLMTRVFLSCGLAELSAMQIAPGLRNGYFAAMAGTLLGAGCSQSLWLARLRRDPMQFSVTRLRSIMEELSEICRSIVPKKTRDTISPVMEDGDKSG
jgi:hypothetical protein